MAEPEKEEQYPAEWLDALKYDLARKWDEGFWQRLMRWLGLR